MKINFADLFCELIELIELIGKVYFRLNVKLTVLSLRFY